jgi:isopentenyl-diphosphate Delta-isomerase
MSQEDFMTKDECLLLDEEDRVVGQASKYDCHRFTPEQVRTCVPWLMDPCRS